ncbi:A32-like packaging ATPase [Tupanvirus deep ocean]|uniref:A32-like packaging ATPase n=2 Tax=Tupanvirus TaxID=2094720 RepID=A0AC62A7Y6_9VIRU|nr:A32-like packaging ATPase [Tupanvirus deep ocean]QKU33896.1 A32-like packaging ATPase [Tupanvirus deep ocean]
MSHHISNFLNNKFGLEKMAKHPHLYILGNNESKLNNITESIVGHLCKTPTRKIYVITNKKDVSYETNVKVKICSDVDANIKKILLKQINAIKEFSTDEDVIRHAILVVDCDIDLQNIISLDSINEVILNGRHYHLSFIIKSNKYLDFSPDVRLNFDYIYLAGYDKSFNKKIWYNHLSMFPTLTMPSCLLKYTNSINRCMVVDNRKPSSSLFDKIYFYDVVDHSKHNQIMIEENFDYIDGLCNDVVGYTSLNYVI